ncbi:hypothetical protein CsSME_00024155 [Camellia sinensis var. sinensis]
MQKGLADIELETDSQEARTLITNGAASSCPYRALIEDANFLLRRCKCRISYIPSRVARGSVLAGCGSKSTRPALMRLGKNGPATARDAVRGLCGRVRFGLRFSFFFLI